MESTIFETMNSLPIMNNKISKKIIGASNEEIGSEISENKVKSIEQDNKSTTKMGKWIITEIEN